MRLRGELSHREHPLGHQGAESDPENNSAVEVFPYTGYQYTPNDGHISPRLMYTSRWDAQRDDQRSLRNQSCLFVGLADGKATEKKSDIHIFRRRRRSHRCSPCRQGLPFRVDGDRSSSYGGYIESRSSPVITAGVESNRAKGFHGGGHALRCGSVKGVPTTARPSSSRARWGAPARCRLTSRNTP